MVVVVVRYWLLTCIRMGNEWKNGMNTTELSFFSKEARSGKSNCSDGYFFLQQETKDYKIPVCGT